MVVRRSANWVFGPQTPEPTEIADLIAWLRRQIRKAAIARAWFLGGFSVLAGLNALTYWNGIPDLPRPASPGLLVLDSFGGLRFWSILWAVVAVCGVVSAVMGWRAKPVIVGIATLESFWGICFLGGWIITGGEIGNGYLTFFIYAMFASFTAVLTLIPADRRRRA